MEKATNREPIAGAEPDNLNMTANGWHGNLSFTFCTHQAAALALSLGLSSRMPETVMTACGWLPVSNMAKRRRTDIVAMKRIAEIGSTGASEPSCFVKPNVCAAAQGFDWNIKGQA